MNLLGVSPVAFAIGALLLAAGVAALHLLRVRLRQVDVDTLLFFRLAGAVRQPRVLPGRPSRWLAFLLTLCAALLGWSAFADPHGTTAEPSRVVVVEPAAGALREARLQAAEELCGGQGLGPRGAVIAAGLLPAVLLRAGEPSNALGVRAAALPEAGSAAGSAAALRAAQDLCASGDEIVWIGAVPPVCGGEVPVRVLEHGALPAVAVTELRWQRGEKGVSLVCALEARGAGRAVLLGGQGEAASALFTAGSREVTLGPVTAAAGLRLRLEAGMPQEIALPDPSEPPLRVHVQKDVPPEVALALSAVLAVDAGFAKAEAANAEVLVTGADSDERRPCLVVEPGVGGGPRQALLHDSPVALSLRDRIRRNAPALPVRDGDSVWVEDCSQGGALAKAERSDRLRVRIVDWLLQPATHADVPLLLASALRVLGGRPRELLAPAGQPFAVDAGWSDAAVTASGAVAATLLPADGVLHASSAVPGAMTLALPAGTATVHVLPVVTAIEAGRNADAPVFDGRGGDGAWMPWLLALLLIVLCLDVYLFHRGRLP